VLVASILSELTEAITSAVGDHGLYAVFLLMLGDAVLPANEAVLLYGGALASGVFDGSVVLFGSVLEDGFSAYLGIATAATLGSTLGAVGGWAIGMYLGRPFIERYGRWFSVDGRQLQRAEAWFDRWGSWAVFFTRLMPVVRSVAPLAAGTLEMPFIRFTLITLAASAIYCFGYVAIGYTVGSEWERIYDLVGFLEYAVIAAIVIGAAWLVIRHVRRRRSRPVQDSSGL
jgi:membrane protein DedA with SNARE-associated domain